MAGQHAECRESVGRVGSKRHLALVFGGRLDAARPEDVDHKGGDALLVEQLGPITGLFRVDTARAMHQHHGRRFGICGCLGWQKKLPLGRGSRARAAGLHQVGHRDRRRGGVAVMPIARATAKVRDRRYCLGQRQRTDDCQAQATGQRA